MYIDSRSAPKGEPECRHLESHRPATVSITGSYELVLILCRSRRCLHSLDVPKESFTPGKPDADESYMALTFGTLLSSQGADAHRRGPFGPVGGNPRYITWSVPRGQTRPALPRLPLGRGGRRIFGPRAWGNIRPAPPAPCLVGPVRLRGSVSRTRTTLVTGRRGCKSPPHSHLTPVLAGAGGIRHRLAKISISGAESVT
jgi:hypothetical protein